MHFQAPLSFERCSSWNTSDGDLIFPRFDGQLDYAASAATFAFSSNSIGLT